MMMNNDNKELSTLRVLILKSQQEPLSDSEIEQLNQLMQTDAGVFEAATLIDQLCAFTDAGKWNPLPIAVPPPRTVASTLVPQASQARSSRLGRSTRIYWLLGMAASYLIVASFAWSLARSSLTNREATEIALEAPPQRQFNSVNVVSASPQLVSMTACVWRPSGDTIPAVGESLQSGELLKLVEGIAELKVGEGTMGEAFVRIEGPASVYVRPDGQLGFLEGSMTARTLGNGIGIVAVDTPMGKVFVNGQSVIGLVASNSVCEFHLFTGRALVKPHQLESQTDDIRLEEGEAVRISSESADGISVVKFEASESTFVSARSAGFDPLNLDNKYVRAISESQPNVYWRFEKLSGQNPYYVANQGSAAGMDAVVVGQPGWRQYGTNRVAELGLGTSSAFVTVEPWPQKPLDEYSIEMWVKPLLFHHGEVLCLYDPLELTDGRYQHAMMLETTAQHQFTHRLSNSPANRFRFVHRRLGEPQPISATSLFAEHAYRARGWQHVVAQKQGNRQMLWVDGQLSAERENPASLAENVQILVGQVYPNSAFRRFVGQIDEIAIYDRCLTPTEMHKHIKAAGRAVAIKGDALSKGTGVVSEKND